jgi:hypothetical protein
MIGNWTLVFCVSLMSLTHWSWELRSLALYVSLIPILSSRLRISTYETKHLHATRIELILQLCKGYGKLEEQ